MSASEVVTQAQLSSLDDTDCHASVWEQILVEQRDGDPSKPIHYTKLWGGKGKGGRGFARRTVQPRDVVVENVRLQYLLGDTCLEGATIKLLHNHVYCLVGRNGCGKSTLLKKINAQKIAGWSIQWSSLYIPPTLPPEYLSLTPMEVVTKYVDDCKKDSRKATESQIRELEARMDSLDLEQEEDQMEFLCEELSALEDKLNFEDASIKQQQEDLFQEFGIAHDKPCEELSPLQHKEILLCAACICSPFTNLLLLDEPTNDLDVHGLIRLRQLIEGTFARSTTVVMVSHDIDLINDVSTDIIDMCAKNLWYFPGNYDSYRLMKDQKEAHYLKHSQVLEKKKGQLNNTLRNLKDMPVPKRGGAKKKAKAIASQRKKIERNQQSMNVLEYTAGIALERQGLTLAQRLKLAEITKTVPDKAVQFVLPKVTSQWGEPLITAFDVGYGREEDISNAKSQTTPEVDASEFSILKRDGFLFDCVDLCVEEGSQNCILGPAIPTSCLMKILAKKLKPVEGTIHHASGLSTGYCDYREVSDTLSSVDQSTTALEFISGLFPRKTESELRAHLTAFGLSPTSQAKTPLACLSGGESFRFTLAKIMLDNPPVLCLEHPTSHLDVESVQALAYGLREWNGTLIMICQDASFLRSLEDVKCVVLVPEEGKIRRIIDDERSGMRGMDAYLKSLQNSNV